MISLAKMGFTFSFGKSSSIQKEEMLLEKLRSLLSAF
jgi:hypothetical protein